MKKISPISLSIVLVLFLVLIISICFLYKLNSLNSSEQINTGNLIENIGLTQNNLGEYEKTLITNQNGYPKNKIQEDFPKIKINNLVKDVKLIAEITFTDEFVKKYAYENSRGYFFAIKFFLGDFDNGGYYNVYRKQNGGVGNSYNHNLVGAKLAYQINEGVTRYISLNNKVPVAVDAINRSPSYQFGYLNMEKYINENIGNEIYIGVYLSSVSELKGWELTKIKSLKIVYTGREGDIEVIQ